jgi:EAL domain-containing protein (putative c-di-GMP-specific phosphodiesterase class I)
LDFGTDSRISREAKLQQAFERSEFVVHYQPQVRVRTDEVVGAEALVRHQHPMRGIIYPNQIIPTAEESGLIIPLGEWVLRTACAQNREWQKAGDAPLRMAVNLSLSEFQQPNLAKRIARVLRETGLSPRHLVLEITERGAMQDPILTEAVLQELGEVRVEVTLDDSGNFGSSLNRLKPLGIGGLKIGRSLVRDVATSESSAATVESAIAGAHDLDLAVIAEGVETREQLAFLQSNNCDEYQGYLFSKAWPAEAFKTNFSTSAQRVPLPSTSVS